MKSTKLKESLRNRIRGWLPQEPKLPGKYSGNQQGNRKTNVLNIPLNELSNDTILTMLVGGLLIIIGTVTVFNVDGALAVLQSFSVFTPAVLLVGYAFGFWIVIGAVVLLAILFFSHKIDKALVARNLSRRRLLPYGAIATIIFLTYLTYNSGIQFAYAIPITFILSGILVIKGLKRFSVTLPAFTVLLVSMLFFGTAFAGISTVNYVAENRYLTSADAPNVDTLNLAVHSVFGSIRVYFTDDTSQICHVAFMKEYGAVTSSRSSQYHGPSHYDTEPATTFNHTVENGQANVTTWSYTVLVNITLNQNLKLNLNLYSYYGDITVQAPPTVNTIQTLNLISEHGSINLRVPDTTNLKGIKAVTNSTLEASITSTGQNQDAIVELHGGAVKLSFDISNVRSQILAYTAVKAGVTQIKTPGFTVLSQNGTYFNAETPNYNVSNYKKLDVLALYSHATIVGFDIDAHYTEK